VLEKDASHYGAFIHLQFVLNANLALALTGAAA
jgi:hypothetical protein